MKKNNGPVRDVLIIDAQNDFIEGPVAYVNAQPALDAIISFLNRNQSLRTFYSLDCHPPKHCSFTSEGGTWLVHCVQGTKGSELSEKLSTGILNPKQRPSELNSFYKGLSKEAEEYSAFDARTFDGRRLREELSGAILLCGMSTEFTVKETALAFASQGFDIAIYVPGLAWVQEKSHLETLENLSSQGIRLIET